MSFSIRTRRRQEIEVRVEKSKIQFSSYNKVKKN